MTKIKQEIEELTKLLNEKILDFIKNDLQKGDLIGTTVYEHCGLSIKESIITGFSIPKFNQSPEKLKEKLSFLKKALTEIFSICEDDIFVHLTRKENTYSISSAVKLNHLNKDRFFTNKDSLLPILEQYKKIYEVKENQFECNYCRKATDNTNKVIAKIIVRDRINNKTVSVN